MPGLPNWRKQETAKIVRFHQLGGPEVLKIEEVPAQEPKKGEVRLRVQAMGLSRVRQTLVDAESVFVGAREQFAVRAKSRSEDRGSTEVLRRLVPVSFAGFQ